MPMKWILLMTLMGLVISHNSFCQKNAALDSLMIKYQEAGEDSVKVNLLLAIADVYETNNQDSSIFFLEKAKLLAEKLGFKRGLYKYYAQSAILSFTKGDYNKAMEQSTIALQAAKELGDENLITNIINNIGIVYQYLGDFDKQLDFSLQALTRIEQSTETKKLCAGYHNVANAYSNLKRYRKAVDYCIRGIKAYEQYGGNYINRVYASLGQGYQELNQYDSALFFHNKAILKSVEFNDKYAEATIYSYMADTYASLNDFTSMLEVSKKSLALSKELQSRQMLAGSLYNIAFAHYYNNEQQKAKLYIKEALQIAVADSLLDELKNSYITKK